MHLPFISLVFSTTANRGFQTGKAVAGMFITSALKRFQAVISGITGRKFYRLLPEKENTVVSRYKELLFTLMINN